MHLVRMKFWLNQFWISSIRFTGWRTSKVTIFMHKYSRFSRRNWRLNILMCFQIHKANSWQMHANVEVNVSSKIHKRPDVKLSTSGQTPYLLSEVKTNRNLCKFYSRKTRPSSFKPGISLSSLLLLSYVSLIYSHKIIPSMQFLDFTIRFKE